MDCCSVSRVLTVVDVHWVLLTTSTRLKWTLFFSERNTSIEISVEECLVTTSTDNKWVDCCDKNYSLWAGPGDCRCSNCCFVYVIVVVIVLTKLLSYWSNSLKQNLWLVQMGKKQKQWRIYYYNFGRAVFTSLITSKLIHKNLLVIIRTWRYNWRFLTLTYIKSVLLWEKWFLVVAGCS